MSGFFSQAVKVTSMESTILEASEQYARLWVHLPMGQPIEPLLGRMAVQGHGCTVVVCPHPNTVHHWVGVLSANGYRFPDVASLTGDEPPHQSRMTVEGVQNNQVRLLLISMERMGSLSFLNVMAHGGVDRLVMMDAQILVSEQSESYGVNRCLEGLERLQQLPPILLLTPLLPKATARQLHQVLNTDSIRLGAFHPLKLKTPWSSVRLDVHRVAGPLAKMDRLEWILKGRPSARASRRFKGHGRVMVLVSSHGAVEQLAGDLQSLGYSAVFPFTPDMAPHEIHRVIRRWRDDDHIIVVATEPPAFLFPVAGDMPFSVVVWSSLSSLGHLYATLFWGQVFPEARVAIHPVHMTVLYDKEDVQHQVRWIQRQESRSPEWKQERLMALRQWRRWVLEEGCRQYTLCTQVEEPPFVDNSPMTKGHQEVLCCGECDGCLRERQSMPRWVRSLLNQILY